MKNKILFTTHWYPTPQNPNFGTFIRKHAKAISLNNEIDVIHFDIQYSKSILSVNLKNESQDGLNYYKIQIRSRFHKVLYFLLPLHYLLFKRLIKKYKLEIGKYDFIHSNIVFPNAIIAFWISKKYNLKQIHSEHWSQLNHFFETNVYKKAGLKALQNSILILPVSKLLESQVNKLVKKETIIVPNIINSKNFYFKEKSLSKDNINFICIANWDKPKNPFLFLEALNRISVELSEQKIHLTFIGEGRMISEIKNQKYNFTIQFEGFKSSEKLQAYFEKSAFFVHASDFETFSIVIIEALYTGTPVIVSNVGIASEIINETNGIICEDNEWYNQIKKAINTSYNYESISKEISKKYDESQISDLITKLYNIKKA